MLELEGVTFSLSFSDVSDRFIHTRHLSERLFLQLVTVIFTDVSNTLFLIKMIFSFFRDLLHDKDFEETIKKIKNEPVPYFGMLDDDDGESPPAPKESERQVAVELQGGEAVEELEGSGENGEQPHPETNDRQDSASESPPEDHENPPAAKESERQITNEPEVSQTDDELEGFDENGEQFQPETTRGENSTSENLPEKPQVPFWPAVFI